MTDTFTSQSKAARDLRMLVQVEQWMVTIQEIGREECAEMGSASDRLERLLAPSSASNWSMIPKSGNRFSEKIMPNIKSRE